MDQRIALVNSIKQLDMNQLSMLGVLMSSKEYKSIDNDGSGANKEGESMPEEQKINL